MQLPPLLLITDDDSSDSWGDNWGDHPSRGSRAGGLAGFQPPDIGLLSKHGLHTPGLDYPVDKFGQPIEDESDDMLQRLRDQSTHSGNTSSAHPNDKSKDAQGSNTGTAGTVYLFIQTEYCEKTLREVITEEEHVIGMYIYIISFVFLSFASPLPSLSAAFYSPHHHARVISHT